MDVPADNDWLTRCGRLSASELVERGYLQEANRRFFHPLGLALAVLPDEGDALAVLDSRDDPEGLVFSGLGPEQVARAQQIDREWQGRAAARQVLLGECVQPLPTPNVRG